jgi:hypothetical protein
LTSRPLLASAVMVGVLLFLTLTVCAPRYESNDDAGMNLIAAGRAYSDSPDEHLLFSNVLVGLALKGLYGASPGLPWYGLYLIGVTALSLVGLCYALLRARPVEAQLLLTGGLLLAAGLPCLVLLQFTRAAALAALAGLTLLLAASSGRAGRGAWAGGLLLLLVACLVRFDSFLLIGAVLAPAVAVAVLSPGVARRRRLLLAGCLLGVLAAGAGLGQLNRWYYEQDEGWRGFYEFNALRAEFTDNMRVDFNEHTESALRAAGWAPVDLGMLCNWNFADPERFSADRLRAVLDRVGDEDRVTEQRSVADCGKLLAADKDLLALLGFGAACLALTGGGWRARAVPLLCLLAAAAVSLWLFLYYHLPARVSFPAFAGFAAVAVFGAAGVPGRREFWPGTPAGAWRAAVLVLAAGLLAWRFAASAEAAGAVRARHLEAAEMMERLGPRPRQLFVLWAASFPFEDVVYPLKPAAVPPSFKAVSLGVLTTTPITAQRLREFGVTDLYRSLCANRDVLIVCNTRDLRLLAGYMRKHYGVHLGVRPYFADPVLRPAYIFSLTAMAPPRTGPGS